MMVDLKLLALERALVRHGVIHAAAIDDPEGFDDGQTREGVLKVFEELTGMVGRKAERETMNDERKAGTDISGTEAGNG